MKYVYEFRLQFFGLNGDGSLHSMYDVNDRGEFFSEKKSALERFNLSCENATFDKSATETDLFNKVFAEVSDIIAARAFICEDGLLVAFRFVRRHYLR